RPLPGSSRPGAAGRARGGTPLRAHSRGNELVALGSDAVDQLLERAGELLHPFALERGYHVVVVDPGLSELLQCATGAVDVPLERRLDAAVILERLDRRWRHRVHGLRPDQL